MRWIVVIFAILFTGLIVRQYLHCQEIGGKDCWAGFAHTSRSGSE